MMARLIGNGEEIEIYSVFHQLGRERAHASTEVVAPGREFSLTQGTKVD